MNRIVVFLAEYWSRRKLIAEMAVRDFRLKYAGSLFGLLWAIIQPLVMLGILSFVFTYGLRSHSESSIAFVPWFFSASIAWNFFNDAWVSSTNSYIEYAYLVKKVNFRLAIIPLVKILSSLLLHFIFIAIVIGIVTIEAQFPAWHLITLPYFVFCTIALVFSISWISASINVFFRDASQLVNIFTQIGFWATPIIWDIARLPEAYQKYLKLNPVIYITEGYRSSLLAQRPMAEIFTLQTVYFWSIICVALVIGSMFFKRLKPHFVDVL